MIVRIKDDKGNIMGKTAYPCKAWTLSQDDMFRNDESFNIMSMSAGMATTCEIMIAGKVINQCSLAERRQVDEGGGLLFRPGFIAIEFPHAPSKLTRLSMDHGVSGAKITEKLQAAFDMADAPDGYDYLLEAKKEIERLRKDNARLRALLKLKAIEP